MKRDISRRLVDWMSSDLRKPLIVRGARQVGKSYTIVDFGENHFEGKTHTINFEKRPEFKQIFEINYDVERILSDFEILLNSKITIGKDLLFLDEIQDCPKAIVALRYFYEQLPELHVIAAGSLIEFAIGDTPFPVGRVQLLNMYPMTFYEFLKATGNDLAAEVMAGRPQKVSGPVHKLLADALKRYFFIGGMPECVKTYADTKSMADVFEIQSDLIATFRQDFSKYGGRINKSCMNSVLFSTSKKIGEQIKYAHLAEGYNNLTIKNSFELLELARLFTRVRAASPAGLPLGASASEKKFKAIMLDVGLMSNLSGIRVSTAFQEKELLSIFRGKLAEQFVGQELLSAINSDIYYWSRDARGSNAETDFLVEKQGKVVPVEVKSGQKGSLKSLHLLMDTYKNIDTAYVFSDAPFLGTTEDRIQFLPLYFVTSIFGRQV